MRFGQTCLSKIENNVLLGIPYRRRYKKYHKSKEDVYKRQALYTANQVGKGDGTDFKVDITMTAHWPLVIDTVDPNDDEQQQQLTSAIQNISQEDLLSLIHI